MEPVASVTGGSGGGLLAKLYASRGSVPLLDETYAFICLSLLFTSAISTAQTDRGQDTTASCFNFTRGNELQKEFYSPGWPNPYPNNADCVRTITAPEGQIIQVDFREVFEMEDGLGVCENDFLLVRDGQETYSQQLARVCGKKYPQQITSKGRHLWLQFKSDDNLRYRGFHAVYTFHEDQTYTQLSPCKFEVSGPETIISTSNITDQYIQEAERNAVSLDCSWRVLVTPGREIQVSFTEFILDKPNECDMNFVEILYGPELHLDRKAHFCSSKADSVKLPISQDVTFRFFAAPATLDSLKSSDKESASSKKRKMSVLSVITELRGRKDDETCTKEEFDCDDLYCISRSLVCNDHYNCDKQLDEKGNCGTDQSSAGSKLFTKANVVIMVIGAALLFGLCFSVCWNCVRKLREDFREKEEYVRQSREDDLDALTGDTSRTRSRTTLADGGCYVPGPEIMTTATITGPAARENRNGGVSLRTGAETAAARQPGEIREDTIDLDVETIDRSCQTPAARRDSRDSGGSGASTPPPPPPPITRPGQVGAGPAYRHRRHVAPPPPPLLPPPPPAPVQRFAGGRGTHRRSRPHFGSDDDGDDEVYDDDDDDDADDSFLRHHSRPAGNETPRSYRSEAVIEMTPRPCSLHSAKSAPDVIVKL